MPRSFPTRPDYKRKRPAPRMATGEPRNINDTVTWTRDIQPRERYRIVYRDGNGELSDRVIELQKLGESRGTEYFGAMHVGRFKTFRLDRLVSVTEQLTTGHTPSLQPMPTYSTELPAFPLPNAVYKMATQAVSNRTWTVDLNRYICACPEKRIRGAAGYAPGQLGYVCSHMAKAILEFLPANSTGWTPALVKFLQNPRRIHIDSLR